MYSDKFNKNKRDFFVKRHRHLLHKLLALVIFSYIVYITNYKNLTNLTTEHELAMTQKSSVELNKIKFKNFYVIANIFNPASFHSRYDSYKKFEAHIKSFGVQLLTVELAFDNQTFHVTEENNSNHIQLRTHDILWYKENLINIAIKRLPATCEYVAWIDLEVEFLNKNWVEDTIYALEKYKVVQLFEVVQILGSKSQILEAHASYTWCYITNESSSEYLGYLVLKLKYNHTNAYFKWLKHELYCTTGYAWAAKVQTLRDLGGLFDKMILGDGDKINAKSYTGEVFKQNLEFRSEHFLKEISLWQNTSFAYVQKNVGYVSGAINHLWHGSRKDRKYVSRRNILNSVQFPYNPRLHLYYDEYGLLHFKPQYRNTYVSLIMKYFLSRNEDFIDENLLGKT